MRYFILAMMALCLTLHANPDPDDDWALYEIILGTRAVEDPVVAQLIDAPVMQRLREIDQHGIVRYFSKTPHMTRFGHSLGVYALLKRFNAPWEEQVAGLLHDASHTVFSHVGDHVFNHDDSRHKWSYQDTIHLWSLNEQGVEELIAPYGLTCDQILPENPKFTCLEQQLPDMCADRLEYNLHTAWILDILSCHEVEAILDDLSYEESKWFLNSTHLARKVGMHSLSMTLGMWGPPWNAVLYRWTSLALHRAVEVGLLTFDEIHFSTDGATLATLSNSDDPLITWYCHLFDQPRDHFELCDPAKGDWHVSQKFRGIDPLVKTEDGLARLSDVDPMFRQMFLHVRDVCAKGWDIRWTDDFATELQELAAEDQASRMELLQLQRTGRDIETEVAALHRADRVRTDRLKAIMSLIGWPTKSRVGAEAAKAAWILAQHADHDPEFQYHVLTLMEPLLFTDEVDSEHVALLTDRVRVARGQPQLYGTQGRRKGKRFKPSTPILRPDHLDERRDRMGLPPHSDYVEELQEQYASS